MIVGTYIMAYRFRILIGAPNTTVNGVRGHGQLYVCKPPTNGNITCEISEIRDTSNLCGMFYTACY